ncbi:MAG: cyclic nucleotide-binding domain-containing protein [Kiloniellaceae bacterium]
MSEERFVAGHVIYREGEPGAAVFVITEGEVEVLREVGDEEVRLAVLGNGAIFGETSVIRNQPRSTTVRALGSVTLIVIPKDTFLSIFGRDNPLALPLLRLLCERLLHAYSQLMAHRIYTEGARHDEVRRIRLLPASPEMRSQIGSEGVVVADLPFHVGRHLLPDEATTATKLDLTLQALGGDQISPLQFAIEGRDGRLVVRDLESHLGTLVNGRRIGHFEQSDIADLRFGANRVQAGGLESPFRFNVIVERAEA